MTHEADLAKFVRIADMVLSPLAAFIGNTQGAGTRALHLFDMGVNSQSWAETVDRFPITIKSWTEFYALTFERSRMLRALIDYTNRFYRPLVSLTVTRKPRSTTEIEALDETNLVNMYEISSMTDAQLLELIHVNATLRQATSECVAPELILGLAPDLIRFAYHPEEWMEVKA